MKMLGAWALVVLSIAVGCGSDDGAEPKVLLPAACDALLEGNAGPCLD